MTSSGAYASPPCMATEVDTFDFDPVAGNPEQALDVARWRRAQRKRLFDLRDGLGQSGRADISHAICGHLETLLDAIGLSAGMVLAAWWPIKGEADVRPLLMQLHEKGIRLALPVVAVRAAPLIFRRWTPGGQMERGVWNIPVPPPEAEVLSPDLALTPCLGWDAACYRLGWGGGYYDRTLATQSPRPVTIGVALAAAQLATIFPQPHDVALNMIVTEAGLSAVRQDPL